MQANSRRKRSQWNYHTHLTVELPLVEWGSAAVPKIFAFFHTFAASSSTFLYCYNSFQDSQATFGTKFWSKHLKITCTGHCPSGITMLEWPMAAWGSAAVPWHFSLFMHVTAVICFFAFHI